MYSGVLWSKPRDLSHLGKTLWIASSTSTRPHHVIPTLFLARYVVRKTRECLEIEFSVEEQDCHTGTFGLAYMLHTMWVLILLEWTLPKNNNRCSITNKTWPPYIVGLQYVLYCTWDVTGWPHPISQGRDLKTSAHSRLKQPDLTRRIVNINMESTLLLFLRHRTWYPIVRMSPGSGLNFYIVSLGSSSFSFFLSPSTFHPWRNLQHTVYTYIHT